MLEWIKTHRYCLVGLYLFVFLAGFFIIQQIIVEPVYVVHSVVDDWIPFNEWFVLPYVLWYPWFPGFLLYFMFKDKAAFLRLCFVMFLGMTICLVIYVIWPNGVDLRREITADNFCADIVRLLRAIDSPVNVCPSIHVSSTTAVHRVICTAECFRHNYSSQMADEMKSGAAGAAEDKKSFGLFGQNKGGSMIWLSRIVTWAICLSTMFIKQHSIIDVIWGWVLTEALAAVYLAWEKRGVAKRVGIV